MTVLFCAGDGGGSLKGSDRAGAGGYKHCEAAGQTAGSAHSHPKGRTQMSGGESTTTHHMTWMVWIWMFLHHSLLCCRGVFCGGDPWFILHSSYSYLILDLVLQSWLLVMHFVCVCVYVCVFQVSQMMLGLMVISYSIPLHFTEFTEVVSLGVPWWSGLIVSLHKSLHFKVTHN